jgi:uncharacterized integral membrane protein
VEEEAKHAVNGNQSNGGIAKDHRSSLCKLLKTQVGRHHPNRIHLCHVKFSFMIVDLLILVLFARIFIAQTTSPATWSYLHWPASVAANV